MTGKLTLPTSTPVVQGFEQITRFWLASHQRYAVKVKPGEHYVTADDELLVTTLGSCIAACMRDPQAGVAGMNHFILPEASSAGLASAGMRYGVFAMEQLINDLLHAGAQRERLEIKITGGGQVLGRYTAIGQQNIDFIRDFLRTEGLCACSEDLGGSHPRKVMYVASEGRLRVKRMAATSMNRLINVENHYQQQLGTTLEGSDAELF